MPEIGFKDALTPWIYGCFHAKHATPTKCVNLQHFKISRHIFYKEKYERNFPIKSIYFKTHSSLSVHDIKWFPFHCTLTLLWWLKHQFRVSLLLKCSVSDSYSMFSHGNSHDFNGSVYSGEPISGLHGCTFQENADLSTKKLPYLKSPILATRVFLRGY